MATDTTADIEKSMVTVGSLNAYLARPAGGSAGGMLLLPMITGIGAQVREWADDLARAGKRVLGVLNKVDGASAEDVAAVLHHVRGGVGALLEDIVPFSATRARIHASSSASVKGFLPPIGNPAGLPVSAWRLVQRIADEWLN